MMRYRMWVAGLVCSASLLGTCPIGFGAAPTSPRALQLTAKPAKPLFTVGISGGFTGVTMTTSVYADGRVVTVRSNARDPMLRILPVSRTAVHVVMRYARSSGALTIPRALQLKQFGADIPTLLFSVTTRAGVIRVQATGSESTHLAGTAPFFPVWSLLYALAGYPSQLGQ